MCISVDGITTDNNLKLNGFDETLTIAVTERNYFSETKSASLNRTRKRD